MAIAESNQENKRYYHRKCSKCQAKMHTSRKYCCMCSSDLGNNDVYETSTKPLIYERRNLDLPFISCERCGLNCSYCASFGVGKKNEEGYGGLDCERKKDSIMCTCCRYMITNQYRYSSLEEAIKEAVNAVQRIANRRESGNSALAQSA